MDLLDIGKGQAEYESRFSCLVCMSPKLRMVYGLCQHRMCVDCLYTPTGRLKGGLERCPMCQRDSFPHLRPDIPEDNVHLQRAVGVRDCSVGGCGAEFWEWEREDHMRDAHGDSVSFCTPVRTQVSPAAPAAAVAAAAAAAAAESGDESLIIISTPSTPIPQPRRRGRPRRSPTHSPVSPRMQVTRRQKRQSVSRTRSRPSSSRQRRE